MENFLEKCIFPKLTSLKIENFNSWIFLGDIKKFIKILRKLPLGKAKGQNGISKESTKSQRPESFNVL